MIEAVDGIILAAGLSRRMGQAKLMLPVGRIPLISRVVGAALNSRLTRVILVTGPSGKDLLSALGPLAVAPRMIVAANPHPARGMSSSLRRGLEFLDEKTQGVMIILGDQPFITEDVIDALITAFSADPGRIIVPVVRARRSNPVIFPVALVQELKEVTGDVGGRYVVQRNSDFVVELQLDNTYDDSDIDTPDDLRRMADTLAGTKRSES